MKRQFALFSLACIGCNADPAEVSTRSSMAMNANAQQTPTPAPPEHPHAVFPEVEATESILADSHLQEPLNPSATDQSNPSCNPEELRADESSAIEWAIGSETSFALQAKVLGRCKVLPPEQTYLEREERGDLSYAICTPKGWNTDNQPLCIKAAGCVELNQFLASTGHDFKADLQWPIQAVNHGEKALSKCKPDPKIQAQEQFFKDISAKVSCENSTWTIDESAAAECTPYKACQPLQPEFSLPQNRTLHQWNFTEHSYPHGALVHGACEDNPEKQKGALRCANGNWIVDGEPNCLGRCTKENLPDLDGAEWIDFASTGKTYSAVCLSTHKPVASQDPITASCKDGSWNLSELATPCIPRDGCRQTFPTKFGNQITWEIDSPHGQTQGHCSSTDPFLAGREDLFFADGKAICNDGALNVEHHSSCLPSVLFVVRHPTPIWIPNPLGTYVLFAPSPQSDPWNLDPFGIEFSDHLVAPSNLAFSANASKSPLIYDQQKNLLFFMQDNQAHCLLTQSIGANIWRNTCAEVMSDPAQSKHAKWLLEEGPDGTHCLYGTTTSDEQKTFYKFNLQISGTDFIASQEILHTDSVSCTASDTRFITLRRGESHAEQ